MRRREFITLLGGAAAAWPLAARAQQGERMRRVGVLMRIAADDPEGQTRLAAFLQGLRELGWTDGRNVRIEYRWGAGDVDRYRAIAAELVALAPDVILATGSATVAALQQATRTVPIVFANVTDPVGGRFRRSLARPGGNATGIYHVRIRHRREMARVAQADRAARDARRRSFGIPAIAAGIGQFGAIQAVAPSLGVELSPVDRARRRRDRARHRGVRARAEWRPDRDGERVGARSSPADHRACARHRLPAVYAFRDFVASGGLISYGRHH